MSVQLLKGFRDYPPREMVARGRMIELIEQVFRDFGYGPLSTPALEYAAVLMGKYGEEGDKLLYRFQDNGARDVALRYDLTVPLARFLACNTDLPMPFRRYALAPVWRAERPQKGRFREFMQCDADLVGADSAAADAEIIMVGAQLMQRLGLTDYRIRLNHRGVLDAVMEKAAIPEPLRLGVIRVLDKFHKVTLADLNAELATLGLDATQIESLNRFLAIDGDNAARLAGLRAFCGDLPVGAAALARLTSIFELIGGPELGLAVLLDPTIARGLDYYTGVIYETFLEEATGYGSVMSGGRYDHLLGATGGRDLPAIGISLGLDRLYAAMLDRGQIQLPKGLSAVLVAHFDETAPTGYALAAHLRAALPPRSGVEFHPLSARLKKQLAYADEQGIAILVIPGPDEVAEGKVTLRNMKTGDQATLPLADRAAIIQQCQSWLGLGA